MGFYYAFGQYYRFAAVEAADEAFRSRAISLVVAGGVVGAFLGPGNRPLDPRAVLGPFLSLAPLPP